MEERSSAERRSSTVQRRERSRKRKDSRGMKILGTLLAIFITTGIFFSLIFMIYVRTVLAPTLDVDASAYTLNLSSVIYYQDDAGEWQELQKVHGIENRTLVEYSDIPEHVWQALVSIEDQRFFEHKGVDWRSTAKAVFNMVSGSDNQRGGSTLTQQVIKNLTGENETTIKRKVTEIFRALRFAENYSREEILTMYLNLVYFGDGCYGIDAAAETYFGKSVSELSVAEGASIVGITQYPYQYDPSRGDWFREQNKKRQLDVLYKMNELGYLDDEAYEQAKNEPLVFTWDDNYVAPAGREQPKETASGGYDSYMVEKVFKDVVADLMEQKGYSKSAAEDLLYTGGYQIYSTIDPDIQEIAERVYNNTANLNYVSGKGEQLQSGMTIVDNATGNIVAIAGRIGGKTGAFDWNYATNPRPCGSAIKPLGVYAPAMDAGVITQATVLDDYPVRIQSSNGGAAKAWPKNAYSGYKGLITVREALRVSTNTTAVRVLEMLTAPESYNFLTQKLNFTTLVNSDINSAALALGGFTYGVTTTEMAAAYSTFANNGIYTKPRSYVEVRDNKGNVVLNNEQESWPALKESTVTVMNGLLKNVVSSGTGTEAAFSGMTIAGKTGTTSSNYDRYFVGYTPYYTAAVWIGYDHPTKIAASGNPAAQLWRKVMSQVHESLPNKDFTSSGSDLVSVTVCAQTGLLAGGGCSATQTVSVPSKYAPSLTCDGHVSVEICTEGERMAHPGCPEEGITTVNAVDLSAPNVQAGMGYERQLLGGSVSTIETENGLKEVTNWIYANDSMSVYSDLVSKGECVLHDVTEPTTEPEEGPVGGEVDPEDPTGSDVQQPEEGGITPVEPNIDVPDEPVVAEKPVEKPVEKPAEKPAVRPVVRPSGNSHTYPIDDEL